MTIAVDWDVNPNQTNKSAFSNASVSGLKRLRSLKVSSDILMEPVSNTGLTGSNGNHTEG